MSGLSATWAAVTRDAVPATARFHTLVEDGAPGLVPLPHAHVFFPGLGRLATGVDDPDGRAASLAVLARIYRRLGLAPVHHDLITRALVATVGHFGRTRWTAGLDESWTRATGHALGAVAGTPTGAGPGWWPAEVTSRSRPAPGISILTVRPQRCLPYRPGDAIPVSLPGRLPGVWRWYSPANAPRPDGSIELHVRAVPDGPVSGVLASAVQPGEMLHLGPAAGVGLGLDRAGTADLLLIAGGTGLAPLRALLEQLAAGGRHGVRNGRRATLIVGARTLDELYDPVTLDTLQCAHDSWLTVRPVFSRDPWVDPHERGTGIDLALRHLRKGQEIHLCGPSPMVRATQLRLMVEGVPAERIRTPAAPS